jgi:DNA-binding NarL/FixJ family response regulator
VLIVDDDEPFAVLLQDLLTASPEIEVVGWGSDGLQALSLTETLRPDVVTMDLDMPRLDGVEATRLILAQHPEIAVILVSGSDYQEKALEGHYAGARDYIRKSRIEDDLVSAVLGAVSAACS